MTYQSPATTDNSPQESPSEENLSKSHFGPRRFGLGTALRVTSFIAVAAAYYAHRDRVTKGLAERVALHNAEQGIIETVVPTKSDRKEASLPRGEDGLINFQESSPFLYERIPDLEQKLHELLTEYNTYDGPGADRVDSPINTLLKISLEDTFFSDYFEEQYYYDEWPEQYPFSESLLSLSTDIKSLEQAYEAYLKIFDAQQITADAGRGLTNPQDIDSETIEYFGFDPRKGYTAPSFERFCYLVDYIQFFGRWMSRYAEIPEQYADESVPYTSVGKKVVEYTDAFGNKKETTVNVSTFHSQGYNGDPEKKFFTQFPDISRFNRATTGELIEDFIETVVLKHQEHLSSSGIDVDKLTTTLRSGIAKPDQKTYEATDRKNYFIDISMLTSMALIAGYSVVSSTRNYLKNRRAD